MGWAVPESCLPAGDQAQWQFGESASDEPQPTTDLLTQFLEEADHRLNAPIEVRNMKLLVRSMEIIIG